MTNIEPALSTVRIAVLLTCYNEEAAIASIVDSFRTVLPEADMLKITSNPLFKNEFINKNSGHYCDLEQKGIRH